MYAPIVDDGLSVDVKKRSVGNNFYPHREEWESIEIVRLSSTRFGKRAKWRRFLDFASFSANFVLKLFLMPGFDVVVALTSPPQKGIVADKVRVLPPWSQEHHAAFDEESRNKFRARHGLSENFVVMYSGNHSPCHPLDTLLGAALQLKDNDRIVFAFIGGGSELKKVQEFAGHFAPGNILCLPYQPIEHLGASLSAADLHVVVMGEPFIGILHPCKIYNILLVGLPFIYIGPRESHVTDIVQQNSLNGLARIAQHGDVAGLARQIAEAYREWATQESPTTRVLASVYSKDTLLSDLIRTVEN